MVVLAGVRHGGQDRVDGALHLRVSGQPQEHPEAGGRGRGRHGPVRVLEAGCGPDLEMQVYRVAAKSTRKDLKLPLTWL
jgi:hypothetical protein